MVCHRMYLDVAGGEENLGKVGGGGTIIRM